MSGLNEFNAASGGSTGPVSVPSIARRSNQADAVSVGSRKSAQSQGAKSIAEQYGAAPVMEAEEVEEDFPSPMQPQTHRPPAGREVTEMDIPDDAINDDYYGGSNREETMPTEVHGTDLNTSHADSVTQPLQFALDQGMKHDAGQHLEFRTAEIDGKTHSTGMDVTHGDQAFQPQDFALDQGAQPDRGKHPEFRHADRDEKTHSTGMTVSGAGHAFEPLPISLDYGIPANRGGKYGGGARQSQTFRSLNRGVAPPPVRHARKGPPKKKGTKRQNGFENKAHTSARGSVWGEMGRLNAEPYDQKVINERQKATRDMDMSVLGIEEGVERKTKHNEKVNYERLGQLAISSKRVEASEASQSMYRTQLNKQPAPYIDFKWKPPKNFRTFDPSEYANSRKAKIELADVSRWRPDKWNAMPEFCYKPTRDIGECD